MNGMKSISKEELKQKLDEGGDVQVVNVLTAKNYDLGFIQGSFKIPTDELEDRADELDKGKEVVTYCASYECNASRKAAEKLEEMGFDVKAYEGGIKEWKEAGYPTEKSRGSQKAGA